MTARRPVAIIAKGSGISLSLDALNAKSHYFARILKAYGMDVTILSSIHYHTGPAAKAVGRYRGIKYFMPSVHPASTPWLKRIFFKAAYIAKAIGFLLHMRRKSTRVHLIFDDNSIPLFPFLVCLEKLGVVELVFNIEEWPLAHDLPRASRMRAHSFVSLALKTSAKVVCVSSYLVDRARQYNLKAKVFKLPALTDFGQLTRSDPQVRAGDPTRFLFCGSVAYAEVIDAIITAYESASRSEVGYAMQLVLVLHGNAGELGRISGRAAESAFPIRVLTALSDNALYEEYSNATVLLAPLRLTEQDEARFPQKIAEYAALGRPIITTYVGEPRRYFVPDESAIFMDDFSVSGLAEKMRFAVHNREKIVAIGKSGNAVGRKHFDYRGYVSSLGEFVTS